MVYADSGVRPISVGLLHTGEGVSALPHLSAYEGTDVQSHAVVEARLPAHRLGSERFPAHEEVAGAFAFTVAATAPILTLSGAIDGLTAMRTFGRKFTSDPVMGLTEVRGMDRRESLAEAGGSGARPDH